MADIMGNLAIKRRHYNNNGNTPAVKVLPKRQIKARRVDAAAVPDRELAAAAKAVQIRRALTRQRIKTLLGIITVVFMISGLFAFVVYRQAMILEMNFANLSLEREVNQINQKNSQISEELAQKTNLDQIRHQAVDRLGLQDPARAQIVEVRIPYSDRVIYASPPMQGLDEEAYLSSVFSSIEGYFRTVNQQRQGE